MQKTILLIVVSLSFFSCKKEMKSVGFENYYSKMLICDSIKTIINNLSNITIAGKGKGYDLLFTPDTNTSYVSTAGTYQQFSTPVMQMNFRFEPPDKLYYWPDSAVIYEGDYFTVLLAAGSNVVLAYKQIATDKQVFYYYTSQ